MDTTGAVYRQPAVNPAGSAAGSHGPRSLSGAAQPGRGYAARATSIAGGQPDSGAGVGGQCGEHLKGLGTPPGHPVGVLDQVPSPDGPGHG